MITRLRAQIEEGGTGNFEASVFQSVIRAGKQVPGRQDWFLVLLLTFLRNWHEHLLTIAELNEVKLKPPCLNNESKTSPSKLCRRKAFLY